MEVCSICHKLSLEPETVLCYLVADIIVTLLAAVLLLLALTVWLTLSKLARRGPQLDVDFTCRHLCWELGRLDLAVFVISPQWRLPAAAAVAFSGPLFLGAALLSPRRVAGALSTSPWPSRAKMFALCLAALSALAAIVCFVLPAEVRTCAWCQRRHGPAQGLSFEVAELKFYQAAKLAAVDLYRKRLITDDSIDLDPDETHKMVWGIPAVVLLRCALRSAEPYKKGVVMVDGEELLPTWPKVLKGTLMSFWNVRDSLRTVQGWRKKGTQEWLEEELTENEKEWMEQMLMCHEEGAAQPAHFQPERRERLKDVLRKVECIAHTVAKMPASKDINFTAFVADIRTTVQVPPPACRLSRLSQLAEMIQRGKENVVRKIMERQQDWGEYLLIAACNGDKSRVDNALLLGADVDTRSPGGATPLIVAATQGHAEIVRTLLSKRADPALTTNCGQTARASAERRHLSEVLDALP